jgi:hypothetical protein
MMMQAALTSSCSAQVRMKLIMFTFFGSSFKWSVQSSNFNVFASVFCWVHFEGGCRSGGNLTGQQTNSVPKGCSIAVRRQVSENFSDPAASFESKWRVVRGLCGLPREHVVSLSSSPFLLRGQMV